LKLFDRIDCNLSVKLNRQAYQTAQMMKEGPQEGMEASSSWAEKGEDMSLKTSKIQDVFLIDTDFALNQIDFLINFEPLSKVIVPDTVLKHVNKKNIQLFHQLKEIIEAYSSGANNQSDLRQFYYIYNDNFEPTYIG
jgi:hypothetical protein